MELAPRVCCCPNPRLRRRRARAARGVLLGEALGRRAARPTLGESSGRTRGTLASAPPCGRLPGRPVCRDASAEALPSAEVLAPTERVHAYVAFPAQRTRAGLVACGPPALALSNSCVCSLRASEVMGGFRPSAAPAAAAPPWLACGAVTAAAARHSSESLSQTSGDGGLSGAGNTGCQTCLQSRSAASSGPCCSAVRLEHRPGLAACSLASLDCRQG